MRQCKACSGRIPLDRHNDYCSKKCQAKIEGYCARHAKRLAGEVEATTAWRPQSLDVVPHVIAPRVGILSDMHMPLHSGKWLLTALETFEHFGVEHVILNGDVLDNNQISKHAGSYYRRKAELEDDLKATEAVLGLLSARFKHIYWCMGNHCMRLVHRFGGELSVQRVYKMVGSFANLTITARSFVHVNDNVTICHPRQYSRTRGALAQRLTQRWQRHIATGHQHHSAMTASPDGKWQACDIPCMADIELMDYVRNELNDFAEPENGFGIIFGNKIQVFDKFTPWELWGLHEPK